MMTVPQNRRQWSIDRSKLAFQAFYYFFLSSFYTRIIYFPLYLKQLGLSASYAGILTGVIPFIRGAGAPILGYVADKTKLRKAVFLLSITVHTLTPILQLIPQTDEPTCQSTVAMGTKEFAYNKTNYTLDTTNQSSFSNESLAHHKMFTQCNE